MILACWLFSHFNSILLLHNSKAKYLKKTAGTSIFGKGVGADFLCAFDTVAALYDN